MRWIVPLLWSALLFAGCAGGPGAEGPEVDAPPTLTRAESSTATRGAPLDVAALTRASSSRLNTYRQSAEVLEDASQDVEDFLYVTRRLNPLSEDGYVWQALDSNGNSVTFRFPEDGGLHLVAIETYRQGGATLQFDQPLPFAPKLLRPGDVFQSAGTFAAESQRHGNARGVLKLTIHFLGYEEIAVPALKQPVEAARLHAEFQFSAGVAGVTMLLEQTQWLSPAFGELRRDLRSRVRLLGVPLGGFTEQQVLVRSLPIPDAPEPPAQ